ncbi:MAG: metallophosphoesterase family protein [Deltaproteobacteria bacterium]|jgi:Icc-related predicted phosphoesterase|nr:metallophosphoesterase family protein [Deltaproteobacteria bacterium]
MSANEKFWIGVGDIHEDISLLIEIPDLADAAGIIISGDITNRGGRQRASQLLSAVSEINPDIYAQIGNMDQAEITDYLEEKGWNIHAKGKKLAENIGIMGVGYSTPTPFRTPSEVPDAMLGQWLSAGYEQIKYLPKLILVAHDPPFGSKAAELPSGENVGNMSVLEFIQRVQPDICLTGHIHEADSEDFIGKTKVINPGMLCMGGYALIRLKEGQLEAKLMYI